VSQLEKLGPQALDELPGLLRRFGSARPFLVTGGASFGGSGAAALLAPLLEPLEVTRFHDFDPNPKLEDALRGVERLRESGADLLIAVGGGSVMDMAKLIRYGSIVPLDGDAPAPERLSAAPPLIALPTTSGSGSQATHFAVMYVGHKKTSVAHPELLPQVAIVDPRLSASQPPYLTACAGMAALSQAVESYWAIHAGADSRALAARALEKVVPNLVAAVREPAPANREAMAIGAHLAGKAIDLTKTTACHAVSYPLTSLFGVPHGHAVALTLPAMLRFNGGVEQTREMLAGLARLLGARDVDEAAGRLERMMDEAGLERRLSALGLERSDLERVLDNAFDPARVVNNPRKLTREALAEMLAGIF
jgi:alcohol dehydrogenase class IV